MKKITIIWAAIALALPVMSLSAIADTGEKSASTEAVNTADSKQALKEAKAAEKRARAAAEKAEKAAAKQAKAAAKAAAKAEKAAQEQAEKAAKAAEESEREAFEHAQDQAGNDSKASAKAEKLAKQQAKDAAKAAAKAEKVAAKQAEKDAKAAAKTQRAADEQAEEAAKAAAKLEKREAKLAATEARRAARANKIPKAERRVQQQQLRIEGQVAELNALANKPELRQDILESIWREHQISAKRFNKQLVKNPDIGVGDLLVANLISRYGQKGLDEIIASGKETQSWGQVARHYHVNLTELINYTYRVGITARTLDLIEPQSDATESTSVSGAGA